MLFRERPDLLAPFRRGDRAALEVVYWRYLELVARLARQGVYRRGQVALSYGRHEVADLVQEVFTRAFSDSARQSFDGVREYGPFLVTITRNLLVDWARRNSRERQRAAEAELDKALTETEEEIPWADPATVQLVERYLAELDPELRGLHEQRYVLGRSEREAAETLGWSRQQLRTRESKLREGLRRALRKAMA